MNKYLMYQDKAFNIFIVISYILIIFSFLGFEPVRKYYERMHYYLSIYICLFLIWRFNPFTKPNFIDLDRKIAFTAGVFILTTTVLSKYAYDYDKLLKYIKNEIL